MTDVNLITVTEFGQLSPEVNTSKYDAPTISGMISQASRQVTDYLMYSPLAEDIVNEIKQGKITTEGDLLIFPEKLPIITVSAIAFTKGTTSANLTLTDGAGNARYNIDFNKRHIRFAFSEITYNNAGIFIEPYALRYAQFYTKVSYRGGYEASQLPPTIKQAVVLFLKDLFSNQYNAMGASRIRQGSLEFSYAAGMGQAAQESKFIKDAKRLLNPYRRIG